MTARFRKFLGTLGETFWLIPALMVLGGILAAVGLVDLDRERPRSLRRSLPAVPGSTTAAAPELVRCLERSRRRQSVSPARCFRSQSRPCRLAAGQMGPRLLRNFTKDRGNQITLGAFLGTFSYALDGAAERANSERRRVRAPCLALTALAFSWPSCVSERWCISSTTWPAASTSTRSSNSSAATYKPRWIALQPRSHWPSASGGRDVADGAAILTDGRRGYLQQLDEGGLGRVGSRKQGTAIRLLVRPGDYVFPGAPIALLTPAVASGRGRNP